MVNFRTVAGILGVLMIVFAATAGYLFVNPTTVTQTSTTIQTVTQTAAQNSALATAQTVTSTVSAVSTTTATSIVTTTSTATASQSAASPASTVTVAYEPLVGYYLTNSSGTTLYFYARDIPNNGTSACNGTCAKTWPAFYSATLKLPVGVNSSSFGTITRTDGTKQSTYNGWPLYYYAGDKAAAQTNGEGIGGVWYAASPELKATAQLAGAPDFTVGMAYKSPMGLYLTNSSGWTLYIFEKDIPNNGTSACNGTCAKTWPAFYTSNLIVPAGFNASAFATITRTDGTKQLTYEGYPLYYYAPDKAAGQTNGQGVGGVWYAFSLPKAAFPATTTSTTSSTTTTTTTTTTSTTT